MRFSIRNADFIIAAFKTHEDSYNHKLNIFFGKTETVHSRKKIYQMRHL